MRPGSIVDKNQPPRIPVRQRTQHHSIHHRKHRRRSGNPQRQRRNHRHCKRRRLPQLPQRILQVLQQTLQPNPSPCPTRHILHKRRISKLPLDLTPRMNRILAARHPVRNRQADVRLNLRIQFALLPPPPHRSLPRQSFTFCQTPTAMSSSAKRRRRKVEEPVLSAAEGTRTNSIRANRCKATTRFHPCHKAGCPILSRSLRKSLP
jgi:hypothetical protein